jgi:hypothetical protein
MVLAFSVLTKDGFLSPAIGEASLEITIVFQWKTKRLKSLFDE